MTARVSVFLSEVLQSGGDFGFYADFSAKIITSFSQNGGDFCDFAYFSATIVFILLIPAEISRESAIAPPDLLFF